ncbi:hypothetical protein V6N11_031892 [Hibiscus sabdariffa]|uniref:Uncharacterized protein n=1 Tax=Hibiscus sabdariffa TaxID=183260 RepID=A0ABR2SYZ1_9ROSI
MAQLLFVARCVGLSYRFGLLLNRVTRAWTSETGSSDPYPGAGSSLDPRAFGEAKRSKVGFGLGADFVTMLVCGGVEAVGLVKGKAMTNSAGWSRWLGDVSNEVDG